MPSSKATRTAQFSPVLWSVGAILGTGASPELGTDSVSKGLWICFLWLLQLLSQQGSPRRWEVHVWEHRGLCALSWAENRSEVCTDPTTASGVTATALPAQRNGLADSARPSWALQPFSSSRGVPGARAGCPVLTSCLLPDEVFISGSEIKKLACARRARLSLQDGFCLKSLTSSRSAQLMFPNSRSQCFPWTKDKVRQSLLQISGSLSYHEGV